MNQASSHDYRSGTEHQIREDIVNLFIGNKAETEKIGNRE